MRTVVHLPSGRTVELAEVVESKTRKGTIAISGRMGLAGVVSFRDTDGRAVDLRTGLEPKDLVAWRLVPVGEDPAEYRAKHAPKWLNGGGPQPKRRANPPKADKRQLTIPGTR